MWDAYILVSAKLVFREPAAVKLGRDLLRQLDACDRAAIEILRRRDPEFRCQVGLVGDVSDDIAIIFCRCAIARCKACFVAEMFFREGDLLRCLSFEIVLDETACLQRRLRVAFVRL